VRLVAVFGRRRLRTAALATSLAAGCSFLSVRGPERDRPHDCTRNYIVPAADALGSVAGFGFMAFMAVLAGVSDSRDAGSRALPFELLGAAVGVAYGSASIFGCREVSRCRDAIARHPELVPRQPAEEVAPTEP
jgi:hypothetical protein